MFWKKIECQLFRCNKNKNEFYQYFNNFILVIKLLINNEHKKN